MTVKFPISCPHCGSQTPVSFQQGYTSAANPQCTRCGRGFLVKYTWPGGHSTPTINDVRK